MFSSAWTLNKDVYKTRQWNSYCCNNLHGKQCARWQVNRPITFMLASKRQAPRQFVKPPRLGHGSFMLKLKYFHLLWICCRLAVGLLWVQAFDLLYNLHNKSTTNRSNGVWALITVYWLDSILVKTLTSFFLFNKSIDEWRKDFCWSFRLKEDMLNSIGYTESSFLLPVSNISDHMTHLQTIFHMRLFVFSARIP